jgi:hypothetical protein
MPVTIDGQTHLIHMPCVARPGTPDAGVVVRFDLYRTKG